MLASLFIVTALALASKEVTSDQEIPEIVHFTDRILDDGADEFNITDNEGKLVSVVDVFFQEGYLIDKPVSEEERVCLVRQIEKKKDEEHICYARKKLLEDHFDAISFAKIQHHCVGREMFIQEPHSCRTIGFEDEEPTRRKRFLFCCSLKWYWSIKCIKTEKIWWFNWCVEWKNVYVFDWKCDC